jgi:hypothetical protein
VITVVDPDAARHALLAGLLACPEPGCGGVGRESIDTGRVREDPRCAHPPSTGMRQAMQRARTTGIHGPALRRCGVVPRGEACAFMARSLPHPRVVVPRLRRSGESGTPPPDPDAAGFRRTLGIAPGPLAERLGDAHRTRRARPTPRQ